MHGSKLRYRVLFNFTLYIIIRHNITQFKLPAPASCPGCYFVAPPIFSQNKNISWPYSTLFRENSVCLLFINQLIFNLTARCPERVLQLNLSIGAAFKFPLGS